MASHVTSVFSIYCIIIDILYTVVCILHCTRQAHDIHSGMLMWLDVVSSPTYGNKRASGEETRLHG